MYCELHSENDCWKCMDAWCEEIESKRLKNDSVIRCDACGLIVYKVFLAGTVKVCHKCIEYLNRVSNNNQKES